MSKATTSPDPAPPAERHLHRFDRTDRRLHAVLMTSFLGLAATGLPLLFSGASWAPVLARLLGGYRVAGTLHRVFAIALFACFAIHLARLFQRIVIRGERDLLWGPRSLVPQARDVVELAQHLRYFFGRGPRPRFDHFTYWEKFDYWAVFWGMAIIGSSGLMLWFPELFSRFVPGWMFNVALLVHGEEALLAVGFIFTIHFFNSHLRPEKFPMDTVIFTGSVSESELREDRPAEYARLVAEGRLHELAVPPPDHDILHRGRVIGAIAVTIGLVLVALMLHAWLH